MHTARASLTVTLLDEVGEIVESCDAAQFGMVAESFTCLKMTTSFGSVATRVIAPEGGTLNVSGAEQTKFSPPIALISSIRTLTLSDLSPENLSVRGIPALRFCFGVASKFFGIRRSPSVGRGTGVRVGVADGWGVLVGLAVGIGVGARVGVRVGMIVGEGVNEGDGVHVGVGVRVGVRVLVGGGVVV